jgi:hypothetical protein
MLDPQTKTAADFEILFLLTRSLGVEDRGVETSEIEAVVAIRLRLTCALLDPLPDPPAYLICEVS